MLWYFVYLYIFILNTGYIALNNITKGSQSSARKTPAKPFPGHLWDCASWFSTSIWCVVFVFLDYKFLCSITWVSWKRPVWVFWNQKVWLSTSLLKIISCNFIFTILEASIHFIGCLNEALRNANTQAWMNINKYAAHTWELILFFLLMLLFLQCDSIERFSHWSFEKCSSEAYPSRRQYLHYWWLSLSPGSRF